MNLSTFSYSHIYWIFLLPLIGAGADIVTGWIQASINNIIKMEVNHETDLHCKRNTGSYL